MKKLILDRFEGGYAICKEDGVEKLFGIDRQELPKGAKAGDVLEISDEGEICVNEEATRQRLEKMAARQKKPSKRA